MKRDIWDQDWASSLYLQDAVGIGNVVPAHVWTVRRAAFILIYLVFLRSWESRLWSVNLVSTCQQTQCCRCIETLEPKGTKWHIMKWIGVIGCYFLMMFYTTVGGWMLYYCVK